MEIAKYLLPMSRLDTVRPMNESELTQVLEERARHSNPGVGTYSYPRLYEALFYMAGLLEEKRSDFLLKAAQGVMQVTDHHDMDDGVLIVKDSFKDAATRLLAHHFNRDKGVEQCLHEKSVLEEKQ